MTEENKRLGHCCIHFSFNQNGGNPVPPDAPFFLLVCSCLNKWALTCHVLSGSGEVPIISVPWALGPEGNGAREVDTSTKIKQRCRLWLWWHNSLSVSVSWSFNAGITVIWPLWVSAIPKMFESQLHCHLWVQFVATRKISQSITVCA